MNTEKVTKETIKKIEETSDKRIMPLLNVLYELAQGIFYEKETLDGRKKIYTQPPDRQAAQYLVDRALGKPVQAVEGGEKPIALDITIKDIKKMTEKELDEKLGTLQ